MSFEEGLMNLNEDDIFGEKEKIDMEESDLIKNMATIAGMINDASCTLLNIEEITLEEEQEIFNLQAKCIIEIGNLLDKISIYKFL